MPINFTNIEQGEHVFYRLLCVKAHAFPGDSTVRETAVTVVPDERSGFEPVVWQANGGYLTALVPLTPGRNRVLFRLHRTPSTRPLAADEPDALSSILEVVFHRANAPPLHLAILAAADSPVWQKEGRLPLKAGPASSTPGGAPEVPHAARGSSSKSSKRGFVSRMTDKLRNLNLEPDRGAHRNRPAGLTGRAIVDAPPGPRRDVFRAGGLAEVKRRFALQAYLWQAFHADQMRPQGMGRRAFQLDDAESDPDETSSYRGQRSLELLPKIHLLRSRRTLREFRHPDNAQQKANARNGGAMFDFAREALMDPSTPRQLHWSPVAVLVLDTQYDPSMRLIRGHAAVGSGGPGRLSHGVMGSHWLWAAPPTLSHVIAAFHDTNPTDTTCCVNDLDECPTAWQTLNIGSGAFFHEVGHAFNNPHWPSGLMARGYVEFNRGFMTSEPGCLRNGVSSGGVFRPITSDKHAETFHLHLAQMMRARWHPSCHLPTDPALPFLASNSPQDWKAWNDAEPQAMPTPDGTVFKCSSGIAVIEVEVDGQHRLQFGYFGLHSGCGSLGPTPPQEKLITPQFLIDEIWPQPFGQPPSPPDLKAKVRVNVVACNMRQIEVDDFFRNGVAHQIPAPGATGPAFRGASVGSVTEHGWTQTFLNERRGGQALRIVSIRINAGAAFDGLALHYSDGSEQRFGPMGGDRYDFAVPEGDEIAKLDVRCGAWIDAVEVVLRSGRRSGMRGNLEGGSLRVLEPPTGHRIVGLFGSQRQWVHSLGLLTAPSDSRP